ncbi:hypothetical protein ACNOYE_37510 [Nannocystaceae bacterium ST9]
MLKDNGGNLLYIDIFALKGFLDVLSVAYDSAGFGEGFSATLDRLDGAIAHRLWRDVIVHCRAVRALADSWDRNAARLVLQKIELPDEIELPELLTLYLDLMSDRLSFDECRQLANRIALITDNSVIRLQYRVHDSVRLLEIGEKDNAVAAIRRALEKFEEEKKGARKSRFHGTSESYECYRLGLTYGLLGTLERDKTWTSKAVEQFNACLSSGDLNRFGRSRLVCEIGSCHLHLENYGRAVRLFQESLGLHRTELAKIHLAEALTEMGLHQEAAAELDSVKQTDLDEAGMFDWAIGNGELALASQDHRRASAAIDVLELLPNTSVIFERKRMRLALFLAKMPTPKPADDNLALILAKLEGLATTQRDGNYKLDALICEVEHVSNASLSEGVREALERRAAAENLEQDRGIAATTGQKVAKSLIKAAAKKALSEAGNDLVERVGEG